MKPNLIEPAKENGVTVHPLAYSNVWVADITNTNKELKRETKLSDLIKFIADNNIKIKN